jgi:hypothetical protein
MREKLLRITVMGVAGMAIIELVLSQFAIKMTRLSSAELTGISLFAFVILGLVTLFAVTRMKDSAGGKIFAILMNFITAAAAVWYLRLLFSDEIFFRNLYYTMNRQTQAYEMISMSRRIAASIPLAITILGAAVYCLCGLVVLIVSLTERRK